MNNQKKTNICGGKLMSPIDVTDDSYLSMVGLRQPKLQLNPLVFKKTDEEKKALKKLKTKYSPGTAYITQTRSVGRLVIHIANTKHEKDFKTTYTYHDIRKEEIRDIVKGLEAKKLVVTKQYFNTNSKKY